MLLLQKLVQAWVGITRKFDRSLLWLPSKTSRLQRSEFRSCVPSSLNGQSHFRVAVFLQRRASVRLWRFRYTLPQLHEMPDALFIRYADDDSK
jgi:hypothetical protein